MVYFFHQYKKIWRNEATNWFKVVFHSTLQFSFLCMRVTWPIENKKSPWKSAYQTANGNVLECVCECCCVAGAALFLEGFLEWIKKPQQHFNRPPCESNSRKHLACISGFYVGAFLINCNLVNTIWEQTRVKVWDLLLKCFFFLVFLMCLKGSERGYLLRWQMSYMVC